MNVRLNRGVEILRFYATGALEGYQYVRGNRKKYWEKSDRFFNTETAIERAQEFAYAPMSHDCVQPPLAVMYS